jgi:hypothetical protein
MAKVMLLLCWINMPLRCIRGMNVNLDRRVVGFEAVYRFGRNLGDPLDGKA